MALSLRANCSTRLGAASSRRANMCVNVHKLAVPQPSAHSVRSASSSPSTSGRSDVRVRVQTPNRASTDSSEPSVDEIMSPHPVVFHENQSVKEAARIMLDKEISGAPVVNDAGELVGILSESDLMWKGAGAPQDHWILPPVFIGAFDMLLFLRDNKQYEDEVHKILAKTVSEAMTKEVVSIQSGAAMSDAATLMLARKINRLPVCEGKKVVGVLTRHDVLRGMVASKTPFL